MGKLHIIRASAGSGKTHYLTGFFLRTIFCENIDYFKRILAVTFTNKATGEMKQRIIEQLNLLSKGDRSEYLDDLIHLKPGNTEEYIRSKAGSILKSILHEYSWFNIETIDTFFQRVIRAFTRDLGIPGNYAIEIETRPVLEHAIATLIDDIDDNTQLQQWLIRFSEDKILEGKSWNIQSDLLRLGKEIFKEDFTINAQKIIDVLHDKNNLEQFRKELYAKIRTIENKIHELGKTSLRIINENELDQADFFQKGRGIVPYLTKLTNGKIDLPNTFVQKLLDGPEYWPASDSLNSKKVIQLASEKLLPFFIRIVDLLNSDLPRYYTANEILKNIFSLGILNDISSRVVKYRHDKNTFILSDAPVFIHRIIDRNDTPFIYEKLGNRYYHFLIDEFQDTSGLQWDNFKPLISNSLSYDKDCLLVGDVKQSIYRWRNSDWEILASRVIAQYPETQLSIEQLETNWRSKEYLTEFNSLFFSSVSEVMQNLLLSIDRSKANDLPDFSSLFTSVYQDVKQNVPDRKKGLGNVQIRFFERTEQKENPEYYQDILLDQISQLINKGFSPGEIAILVRTKKEGQELAQLLIEKNSEGFFPNNVGVISNESLFLNTSNAVNCLVAALNFMLDPDNDINRGKLINSYKIHLETINTRNSSIEMEWRINCISDEALRRYLPPVFFSDQYKLASLPLYDLMENLIRIFKLGTSIPELPFLQTFLDLVNDFIQTNASDPVKFIEFWKEEGITKSVPATDTQNAIRILTIHKSKGLEFKVVVIPYCNWSLDQKSNTILWAKPPTDEFDFLPIYPVDYTKLLKKSLFANEYYIEQFKSYIDNINLLYVAFTRAMDELIVFSNISTAKKNKVQASTIGDLIFQSLNNPDQELLDKHFDIDNMTFKYGIPLEHVEGEAVVSQDTNVVFQPEDGEPVIDRLFFHPGGYDFFSERQVRAAQLSFKGTVLHAVLSKITHANEIGAVLSEAFYNGLLNRDEMDRVQNHITEGLKDERIARWFDGSGKVLNEIDILLPTGEAKRPDRVVIFKDKVVVVDYKFGSKEHEAKHRIQIQKYMELIEKMGYSPVKGYLWYIIENYIIEI